MTSPQYATWPNVLATLAELIGPEATLKLADEQGGLDRIPIAKSVRPDHPWVAIVGLDAYTKIVEHFGGEKINLPRGKFLHLKKLQIIELAEMGLSGRQIALRTKTTERYVRTILSAWKSPPDPRQTTLF